MSIYIPVTSQDVTFLCRDTRQINIADFLVYLYLLFSFQTKTFCMKQLLFLPVSSLFLFIACKQADTTAAAPVASFSLDSARQDISASNEKFGEAFIKGDSAALASLYCNGAEAFVPNAPKMSIAAMSSEITHMPAMGIKKMVLTSSEVAGGPDIVTETGSYVMSDSTKAIDKGKYIVLWKKEDGKWKMFRDIWNSDDPAQPMAAPAKK